MGNDEITIQNNTTQQVESFMAKDKTIKGKKEQSYLQMLCFRAEPLSEKQVVPYRKKEHIHEPRIIHVAHSPE
ncbi:hypothetical protein, partial [Prosthecochloris sp.]|uniref:hypothetical protein n=1 Tax=Prosthecochloris sp. TaxID=290513 RepID=UPI0025808AFA